MGLIEKIFGSYSKRELKRIRPILQNVLDLEEEYKAMSDEKLRGQTEYLKGMLSDGETLDTILPRAFATCREATRRVLGTPHYPVQIIGGIVLHQGRIAEMRTGEGKTLAGHSARLPERPVRQGRPHRHRQRLPGQARLRVDGQGLPLLGPDRGPDYPRHGQRRAPGRLQLPTSPTAPTTSSASTTSGTTWSSTRSSEVQRALQLRHRGRGGLHPHRRGPDPSDHFRPGGQIHRPL